MILFHSSDLGNHRDYLQLFYVLMRYIDLTYGCINKREHERYLYYCYWAIRLRRCRVNTNVFNRDPDKHGWWISLYTSENLREAQREARRDAG